jgi:hypothetical protein
LSGDFERADQAQNRAETGLKLTLGPKRKTSLTSATLALLTIRPPFYEIKFTLVCPWFGLGI